MFLFGFPFHLIHMFSRHIILRAQASATVINRSSAAQPFKKYARVTRCRSGWNRGSSFADSAVHGFALRCTDTTVFQSTVSVTQATQTPSLWLGPWPTALTTQQQPLKTNNFIQIHMNFLTCFEAVFGIMAWTNKCSFCIKTFVCTVNQMQQCWSPLFPLSSAHSLHYLKALWRNSTTDTLHLTRMLYSLLYSSLLKTSLHQNYL